MDVIYAAPDGTALPVDLADTKVVNLHIGDLIVTVRQLKRHSEVEVDVNLKDPTNTMLLVPALSHGEMAVRMRVRRA